MNKNKIFKILLVVVLCAAILLPFVPSRAARSEINNFDVGDDFKGLKLSIIGDSISTYDGFTNSKNHNPLYLSDSNNQATFDCYYGDANRTDYEEIKSVSLNDTWWMQAAETWGMEVLVNNSWSGSYVRLDTARNNTTEYGAAAYKDRCVNLHMDSQMPDIIAVYMGTNDTGSASGKGWGTKASVDTDAERSGLYTNKNTYNTGTLNSVQAYYIMLSRMIETYPDAEIYCMLPIMPKYLAENASVDRIAALNDFNTGVTYLVNEVFRNKKVYLVDLPEYSGLVDEEAVKDYFYLNQLHPNCSGMDWITGCFLSELLEHSTKDRGTAITYPVTYQMQDAYVKNGQARYAVSGKPFTLNIGAYDQYCDIDIHVSMAGSDVTDTVVSGTTVYIPQVNGPIEITAVGTSSSYYWRAEHDSWSSVSADGYTYNFTKKLSGTYEPIGNQNEYIGNFTEARYQFAKPVVLEHDRSWTMEFKLSGPFTNGIVLMSNAEAGNTEGNTYIHINSNNFMLGYFENGIYMNSGVSWDTIGQNLKTMSTVYRLENKLENGSNMIYLYVNGAAVGKMNQVLLRGSGVPTDPAMAPDISGRDFVFQYFGTTEVYGVLSNCSLEYVKIQENGTLSQKTKFNNYRWATIDDEFVSATSADGFTRNDLTMVKGKISNGTFDLVSFDTDIPVALMHDKPWVVEWKSTGTWKTGNAAGAMLLATDHESHSYHAPYLYRRSGNDLIGFGEYSLVNGATTHYNYGIRPADHGIDTSLPHTYRLINRINEDGSNMVYLYVDNVELGPLDNQFKGGGSLGVKSDWLNGKDFVFHHVGTKAFPIGNCDLDYLQIWEQGSFEFGLDTNRIQQLLDTRLTEKAIPGTETSYTDASWNAYQAALTAAQQMLLAEDPETTQADLDAAAEAVVRARYQLVANLGTDIDEATVAQLKGTYKDYEGDEIYSVELLTGDYSRLGQQTALRIITTPDIAQIGIGTREVLTCSSQVQSLVMEGESTMVKVWLITFDGGHATSKTVEYGIRAYEDPDCSNAFKDDCDSYLTLPIIFK